LCNFTPFLVAGAVLDRFSLISALPFDTIENLTTQVAETQEQEQLEAAAAAEKAREAAKLREANACCAFVGNITFTATTAELEAFLTERLKAVTPVLPRPADQVRRTAYFWEASPCRSCCKYINKLLLSYS
jgi:hypothetical protein